MKDFALQALIEKSSVSFLKNNSLLAVFYISEHKKK
jgi:hypothetical protein